MPGLLAAGLGSEGVRAVLFDFDGTLVDSNFQTSQAISDLLAQRGYQKHPDEIVEYLGSGTLENALDTWFGIPDHEQQRFFAELRPLMYDHYLKDAPTIAPADTLLHEIRARDVTVALVTNRSEWGAQQGIEAAGWHGVFEFVVGHDTTPNPKPHPAPALHTLDLLGLAPADVIFVGDNETDVNCAVGAGIPVVVAIADGDKGNRLAALGATHVRSDLHTVHDLLLHD